jgi:hypothetical protein
MVNLLKFNDAAEALGVKANSLEVMAVSKPHWLVEKNGAKYVDIKAYDKQQSIVRRCYEYNTSTLYWMMKEIFITDNSLSEYMSKKCKKDITIGSWKKFLHEMFAVPSERGTRLVPTLHSEFFRVSYKTISIALDKGCRFESINT